MYKNSTNVIQGKTTEILGDLVIRGKTFGLKADSLDVSGTVSAGQFEGRSRIVVRNISILGSDIGISVDVGFKPTFIEFRCRPEDVTEQNPSAEVDIMIGYAEEEMSGFPTQGVCQMHIGNHIFTRTKSDSCIFIMDNKNTSILTRAVFEGFTEDGFDMYVTHLDASRSNFYAICHE
jgi:hypothetical protein